MILLKHCQTDKNILIILTSNRHLFLQKKKSTNGGLYFIIQVKKKLNFEF